MTAAPQDTGPTRAEHLPAAPLWRRIAAILYDSVVVLALLMVVGYIVLALFGLEQGPQLEGERIVFGPGYRFTLFSAMVMTTFVFFAGFWTRSGQTIGMLAWRVRIQNADGSAITWSQALLRYLSGGASLLCLGLGHFWMLVPPRHETLPDRLSESRVVLLPKNR